MAGGWMKSLHCKSKAVDDVAIPHRRSLLSNASCRGSARAIHTLVPTSAQPNKRSNAEDGKPQSTEPLRAWRRSSSPPCAAQRSLSELPHGHVSRNVVEIIFRTHWGSNVKPFAGKVEVVFKIHNAARTVARFDDYRRDIMERAAFWRVGSEAEENARCSADGNEMMRFHYLGPTVESTDGGWVVSGTRKGRTGISTYCGTGRAHESGGFFTGGRGAMVVCRVIAGRVSKRVGFNLVKAGFDSARGDDGELVVFDARAVLPCFLIVYKLHEL